MIRTVTGGAESETTPVRLLEADVVAIVAWWKQRHVYCFDRAGRCIAIAPTYTTGALGWRFDPTFEFKEVDSRKQFST